jgi:signal transduction histidine kinase
LPAGELRPPTLTPFGLEKSIRSHAARFRTENPQYELHLELSPDGQRLPERTRLAFYRVYQHSLANIVRHAQATRIDVRFLMDAEQAVLEVQDNGRGFQVPERWFTFVRDGHLGLAGAAERAEAIGASLQVTSAPGQGTLVCVTLPFPLE